MTLYRPANGTISDLVWINTTTGVIRTDTDGAIDAEVYEYLYYIVSATDGYWITNMSVSLVSFSFESRN